MYKSTQTNSSPIQDLLMAPVPKTPLQPSLQQQRQLSASQSAYFSDVGDDRSSWSAIMTRPENYSTISWIQGERHASGATVTARTGNENDLTVQGSPIVIGGLPGHSRIPVQGLPSPELSVNSKKTTILIYNGYSYCQDKRCKGTYRYSIRRSTACSGTLILTTANTEIQYNLKKPHNHEPESNLAQPQRLKADMLLLCRTTLLPAKEIFDRVCRTNPEAAKTLTFVSMKSIMIRERAKCRLPVPKTIASLGDVLQDFEPANGLYRGFVIAEDNKMALIFSNDDLLAALANATEIFVDGTFSVVPRFPPMAQLYSIHIRCSNTGIATVFILCEARTTAVYRAVWKRLLELAPGLQQNLRFIMTDYEKAAITAMAECFPNAEIHGCWFHYNQAVFRMWRHLGLSKAPRELVSMAMSMPLTPDTFFDKCLTIMQFVANPMAQRYPQVKKFMSYMRKVWLPMAKLVSVYGCPNRTNNIVESFHNTAKDKLGGMHPGVWKFIENLKQLILDQSIDLARLKEGRQIRRIRTPINRENDEKVLQLQKKLIQNRISLKDFLTSFHKFHDDNNQMDGLPVDPDRMGKETGAMNSDRLIKMKRKIKIKTTN